MSDRTARVAWALAIALTCGACDRDDRQAKGDGGSTDPSPPAYVGAEVCGGCHAAEHAAWLGSHHDLALQPATAGTVLGDFSDVSVEVNGVVSRFYRRGDEYFVETDAADGSLAEFPVVHVFGVEPLQQYLVEYERGRLQALGLAWDTRPAAAGGQRWFHLYGDEPIPAGDPLHWTGPAQNWNSMCADCHSTAVVKGYDFDTDSFATTFAEEDVGCEACHGPGSAHAADPAARVLRHGAVPRAWVIADGARIAARAGPVPEVPEPETCASCHSRRAQLRDAGPLTAFLDAYRPAWLQRGLYFDDGQILDEVYVYGSFLQSRMHAAGVTCSDCHDPHSLALRASGDGLCAGCHSSDIFAVEAHHRHAPADTAPGCVDCHMRAATYMQVDDRRDHSFRVPRPDLSAELGVPNACNDCHADRDAAWAAAIVAGWYPAGRGTVADPASAFAAVRNWQAGALATLLPIAVDPALAPIVRATAVSELGAAIGSVEAGVLAQLAADPSDLVRLALIDASRELAPSRRIPLVQRFLSDAPLALRIAAAEALQSVRAELGPGRQSDLDAAIVDGLAARAFGSDQPQGLLGRAETLAIGGRVADARRWLEVAVGRFPWFAPAWVNLADLERAGGRDRAALEIVDAGLAVVPEADALHIARGLALVRLGQLDAAVAAFADARRLAPDSPYNAYIYAIALNSTGDTATALAELESAASSFPAYADLWYALATISRDAGNLDDAIAYARRGRAGVPSDPRFDALLASFGAD